MSFRIKDPNRRLAMDNPVFMSKTEQAWLFAEQHRSSIIAGALLLCLAVAGLGGLFWYQHDQNNQAMRLQHEAASLYLDRPLDDIKKSKQNLEKSIALFQQILEQYPTTPSAELAQYFLGNALVEQHDYPAAIDTYESYIRQYTDNPILLGLVYQRLGAAFLLNNDRAKAIEAFTTVLALPGAVNTDQVLFQLAKIEEAENSKDKALSYYKRLVAEYPYSPYAGEASLQVKALDPKPAVPPEENDPAEKSTEAPEQNSENADGTE